MDGLMALFEERARERVGAPTLETAKALIPDEMQGYGGVLRGTFTSTESLPISVRLEVRPWTLDERWEVMVLGHQKGSSAFWSWMLHSPLLRIPFMTDAFESRCSHCVMAGGCVHGVALTYYWLIRLSERDELLLLLLNRRGTAIHRHPAPKALSRVPMVLGTNLDRTRRELLSIVEAAQKAALRERDNLFGTEETHAHSGHRD